MFSKRFVRSEASGAFEVRTPLPILRMMICEDNLVFEDLVLLMADDLIPFWFIL
jgi:hypothetical protein